MATSDRDPDDSYTFYLDLSDTLWQARFDDMTDIISYFKTQQMNIDHKKGKVEIMAKLFDIFLMYWRKVVDTRSILEYDPCINQHTEVKIKLLTYPLYKALSRHLRTRLLLDVFLQAY
ncbi:hypothetical protein ACJX0J_030755 [Zea mays]